MKNKVEEEFIILTYRNKYNLPLYDKAYMDLIEIKMNFDLHMNWTYKDIVKEILEYDTKEDYKEYETLEELRNKENGKVNIDTGISKEDIDKFWNEDL